MVPQRSRLANWQLLCHFARQNGRSAINLRGSRLLLAKLRLTRFDGGARYGCRLSYSSVLSISMMAFHWSPCFFHTTTNFPVDFVS
jgi:hypothetical protein